MDTKDIALAQSYENKLGDILWPPFLSGNNL